MAVPDITAEITAFRDAAYGEDVRSALIQLAQKLRGVITSELETMSQTWNAYKSDMDDDWSDLQSAWSSYQSGLNSAWTTFLNDASKYMTFKGVLPNNSDLNNISPMTIYWLKDNNVYTNTPSEYDATSAYYIYTFGEPNSQSGFVHQYLINIQSTKPATIFIRFRSGSTWRDWVFLNNTLGGASQWYNTDGKWMRDESSNVDLNNAPDNQLVLLEANKSKYINYPDIYPGNSWVNLYTYTYSGGIKQQFFIPYNTRGTCFFRTFNGSVWSIWAILGEPVKMQFTSGSLLEDAFISSNVFKNYGVVLNDQPDLEEEIRNLFVQTFRIANDYVVQMLYTFPDVGTTGNQAEIWMRFSNNNGSSYGGWRLIYSRNKLIKTIKGHSIKILFIGNSLTQDGIAYLPYVLKTYYPNIDFKFYMWYVGGYTLGMHYDRFINNQSADVFSVAENSISWTNSDSTTMRTVLSTYEFDIVCMQEYEYMMPNFSESDLINWNNCKTYILNNYAGTNPLEFISLFHAPRRDSPNTREPDIVRMNQMILDKTISDDIIINGLAVYKALSTSLDSLGDQGHLSPDGTHTQEGLPCLLQTWVSVLWILDRLGLPKNIYGNPCRITTDIYNSIHVPGANLGTGVITGTDAENLLAQEIAIQAFKEGKKMLYNIDPNRSYS